MNLKYGISLYPVALFDGNLYNTFERKTHLSRICLKTYTLAHMTL